MFVVLSIIVLVAVFNILSALIMLVRAKRRDIAILRTMGATAAEHAQDLHDGRRSPSACSASLAGLVLGVVGLYFRQPVVDFFQRLTGQNLWDPSVRFLTELPAKTDPVEVSAIVTLALVLELPRHASSRLASAARTDPVQVLRYE